MMSSDADDGSVEVDLKSQTGKWDAFIEVVRATKWILLLALLCFGTLGVLYFTELSLPSRSIVIVITTVAVAGPFVAAYCYLAAWHFERQRREPILLVDEDHRQIGLSMVDPEVVGDLELDGGDRLPDRRCGRGRCYIAKDLRIEQRERVDEEGNKETYGQPVVEVNWQGMIDELQFDESLAAFRAWKDEMVPKLADALDARAKADVHTLQNTDEFALGLLEGAEKDTFFDDPGEAFDWSTDERIDLDEIDPTVEVDDQDDGDDGEVEDGSRYKIDLNGGGPGV